MWLFLSHKTTTKKIIINDEKITYCCRNSLKFLSTMIIIVLKPSLKFSEQIRIFNIEKMSRWIQNCDKTYRLSVFTTKNSHTFYFLKVLLLRRFQCCYRWLNTSTRRSKKIVSKINAYLLLSYIKKGTKWPAFAIFFVRFKTLFWKQITHKEEKKVLTLNMHFYESVYINLSRKI